MITEHGTGYAVVSNSDLTEGRGYPVIIAVCEKKATAMRLAKGKSVQGSDADVVECPLYFLPGGRWGCSVYGPVSLVKPSKEDTQQQDLMDAKAAAVLAAVKAGLTPEQIDILLKPL